MSSLQEAQSRTGDASRPVRAQWDGCSWYGGAQGLSGRYSVEKRVIGLVEEERATRKEKRGVRRRKGTVGSGQWENKP
jgi:hypothetical protein